MKNGILPKLTVTAMIMAVMCPVALNGAWAGEQSKTIETHFGKVTLDAKGYPDQKGIDALYEELDFQRAAQTYLWAMPAVGMEGQYLMQKNFGATGPYDSLLLYGADVVGGMLTPNG